MRFLDFGYSATVILGTFVLLLTIGATWTGLWMLQKHATDRGLG